MRAFQTNAMKYQQYDLPQPLWKMTQFCISWKNNHIEKSQKQNFKTHITNTNETFTFAVPGYAVNAFSPTSSTVVADVLIIGLLLTPSCNKPSRSSSSGTALNKLCFRELQPSQHTLQKRVRRRSRRP